MRTLRYKLVSIFFLILFYSLSTKSQVAIGTSGTSPAPDASAVLLLVGNGTNQGLIVPIVNSLTGFGKSGMVVYNSATNSLHFHNGSAWNQVGTGGTTPGIQISGNIVSLNATSGATFGLSTPAPTATGQLLSWSGTAWESTPAPTITGQILSWNQVTGKWTVANAGGGSVTNVTGTAPISVATGTSTPVISMTQANTATNGFLSSTDWNTFNTKLGALSLTTTGTSGAATLAANTLNIPIYAASSFLPGTGLTLTTNTFSVNTSQNISTLSNLSSNGLIRTSGGTGALSIATPGTDYLTPTGSAAALTGFPTFNQNTTGSAASFTGGLTGDVGGTQGATLIGAGAVNSAKILDGSIAGADLAGAINISTTGNIATTGAGTISGIGTGITALNAGNITTGTLPIARGGTNRTTAGAAGTVLYSDGTALLNTLAGTTGQFLQSNGAGAPTWASSPGWALGGNNGTVDGAIGTGTNFIGTRDNVPLNFIVNNQRAGRIEAATPFATFLGYQAGNVNTGIQNSAIGYQAMRNNTTGNGNTAVGQSALTTNTVGGANTAFGTRALFNNTGANNTAVGNDVLFANTSAGDNTAVGVLSLAASTGASNSSLGAYSLQSNTTGFNNTGIGVNALIANTTGNNNTALGSNANVVTGALTNATAIGANAIVTASNTIQLGNGAVTTVNVGTGTTAKLVAGALQVTGGTLTAGRVLTSDGSGNAIWQSGGSGWALGGNSGTVDGVIGTGTNYIGTSNNVPLNFMVNNQRAGRIESLTPFSTFFGYQAGLNSTSQANTAIGYQALSVVTSSSNTAVGYQAMQNTSGGQNTAVGDRALNQNTNGTGNTAVGQAALSNGNLANYNTAMGLSAMQSTSGGSNTAIGAQAAAFNSSGTNNVFVGYQAGYPDASVANGNGSGQKNTFIGANTGLSAGTQVNGSTAIGYNARVDRSNALVLGGTGVDAVNVGIGTTNPQSRLQVGSTFGVVNDIANAQDLVVSGLYLDGTNFRNISTSASSALLLGDGRAGLFTFPAGAANGVAGSPTMRFNMRPNGVGINVDNPIEIFQVNGPTYLNPIAAPGTVTDRLYNVGGSLFWNGTNISSGGSGWALGGNLGTVDGVIGTGTNFIGTRDNVPLNFIVNNQRAGRIEAAGATANTFYGSQSGNVNTGFGNSAFGQRALFFNTLGSSNTANGYFSLLSNTIGDSNTANGASSLGNNTTGNFNTAFGRNAGSNITTGSNNIAIGSNAQVPTATADNQVRIGNGFITSASIQVAWTVTSDKRWKSDIKNSDLGLGFISRLRPVSYFRNNDESKKREYGFIAQELEAALNKSSETNTGMIAKDDQGMYSVRYNDLMAPMVKAIQEQQKMIDSLKNSNQEFLQKMQAIQKENATLKATNQQLQVQVTAKTDKQETEMEALKKQMEEIKKVLGMEANAKKK